MSGEKWGDVNYKHYHEDLAMLRASADVVAEPQVAKKKQQFFYVVLQNETGTIVNIQHGSDYNELWLKGTEKAKELGLYWSVFDLSGRFVDGNFVPR